MSSQTSESKVISGGLKFALRDRLIGQLEPPRLTPSADQSYVIVISGFPGSGKTTGANVMTMLSRRAFHVQSNSARFVLKEAGLPWGDNVPALIGSVLEEMLYKNRPVILDGMRPTLAKRQMVRDMATKFNAKVFFLAVMCGPSISLARANKRYADGKESTFGDWRASPERYEEYLKSIVDLGEGLERYLSTERGDLEHGGILRIANDGDYNELSGEIESAWRRMGLGR